MNEVDLSDVLEIINGGWALLALSLSCVCFAYVWHELHARHLKVWRWHLDWTKGMRVAAAIFTLSVGIFITRLTIYFWRAFYDAGDLGELQLYCLIFGAALGAVGFLCAIREISKPLFGACPWITTMVALFMATAAMVIHSYY